MLVSERLYKIESYLYYQSFMVPKELLFLIA